MSRINDYLPKILQDILELKKTNESLDVELENISNNIDTMNKETIVATATLYGIKKWEKVLGINPKEGESLDVRRFRIQNILTNKLPFTYRWLVNKLKEITGSESGFTLDISYDDYEITIVLSGLDVDIMAEVQKQLRIAIPANMELLISGPQIQSSEIKVGIGMMYGTKYKIKSAKTGLPAGKNWFNKNGSKINYTVNPKILETGLRVELTQSGNYRYTAVRLGGSELLGKTFTAFANYIASGSNIGRCSIYYGKADGTNLTQLKSIDSGVASTFTVANTFPTGVDTLFALFYGNTGGTGNIGDYVDYTEIQIEPGSQKTDYEPFIEL